MHAAGGQSAWPVVAERALVLSLLLYTLAPLQMWSAYINFCVLPLVTVMFVVESQVVRPRVLPQVKRTGLLATVRVYLATTQ